MTDHTPEPWAFYNGQPRQNQRDGMAKVCVVDKDDPTCVAYGQTLEEARANAARIVACVNACAGIPTEQLGDVKALVKALEFYATAWEGHPGDSGPGGNTPADPEQWPSEYLLDDGGYAARAALAPFRKD